MNNPLSEDAKIDLARNYQKMAVAYDALMLRQTAIELMLLDERRVRNALVSVFLGLLAGYWVIWYIGLGVTVVSYFIGERRISKWWDQFDNESLPHDPLDYDHSNM